MSNEIVLAAIVLAAIVLIYLLRHVIALAVRLIVLAALVLAGYWVWQHRGDLVDAAEPHLGGIGDRLRELDLPVLRDLLDGLDPSGEPESPDDAVIPAPDRVLQGPDERGVLETAEPDRSGDPTAPQ